MGLDDSSVTYPERSFSKILERDDCTLVAVADVIDDHPIADLVVGARLYCFSPD